MVVEPQHEIFPQQPIEGLYQRLGVLGINHEQGGQLPMYAFDPDTGTTWDVVTAEMDPAGHTAVLILKGRRPE